MNLFYSKTNKFNRLFISCLFSLIFVSTQGFCATITAIAGTNQWNVPASWDLNRVPADGDIVIINSTSIIEIRNPNTVSGTSGVNINLSGKLSFPTNGADKLSLPANSVIQINTGGKIESTGGTSNDLISIGATIVWNSTTGPNPVNGPAFSTGSSYGFSSGVLPVKLSVFSVARSGNTVHLKWITATETGNKGFEIERKINGKNEFETIAFVASKANGGNSDAVLSYEFTDANNNAEGSSQYRIKQIDIDSRATFSDIRIVDGSKAKAKTMIYPNPANNGMATLVFNNNENRDIKVFDINGLLLQHWNACTNDVLKLSGLKKGTYLISIQNNQNNQQEILRIVMAQ